jgi:DNA helicase-2/ATP-dependent DNA helicase PcrA
MALPRITPAFSRAYRTLTPEQKQAVDTIEGPVMVIAGPGTGKTQILTLRIANIIKETDTPPDAILALTFTESGVAAMRRRLASIIGSAAYRVHIHTFHGFCNDVIKRFPDEFPRIIGGEPISDIEKISLIRSCVEKGTYAHIKPFGNNFHYVNDLRQKMSELKRENISPERLATHLREARSALESQPDLYHEKGAHKGKMKGDYQTQLKRIERTEELLSVYEAYEAGLRSSRRFDFEDMIVEVVSALSRNADLLLRLQEEYLYVLADEHQDANTAQNTLLELLTSYHEHPNIFVVGDEKQAIFRFQGASLENFLYFKRKYPRATVISLVTSFRSGQAVLDYAHTLIGASADTEAAKLRVPLVAHAKDMHSSVEIHVCADVPAEHQFIAERVSAHIHEGVPASDIAVLYRTNREAELIARALRAKHVLVTIESDQNVLEDPDVRKFLVLLRAVTHLGVDEHMAHVLHVPCVGVTPLDAYKLIKHARRSHLLIAEVMKSEQLLRAASVEHPEKVIALYKTLELLARSEGSVPEIVGRTMRELGYLGHILASERAVELIEKMAGLMRDIEKLSIGNPDYSLRTLLEHLVLLDEYRIPITKDIRAVPRAGSVRLMTAHRSKGLEFEYVYITRVLDGVWGGGRDRTLFELPTGGIRGDDEDERRLLYVAITRAKSGVYLTYPERAGDKEVLPSRFLEEIEGVATRHVYEGTVSAVSVLETPPQAISAPLPDKEFLNELFLEQGLSVTALNNYLTCPWRYFYSNLIRIPTEQSLHLHYGNAVHRALRLFFDARNAEPQSKEVLLQNFSDAVGHLPLVAKDMEALLSRGKEHLSKWYDTYHKTWAPSYKSEYHVEVEYPRTVEGVPRVLLRGDIDALAFESTSGVHVLDYKTGVPKSRNAIQGLTKTDTGDYFRQLIFYRLLLDTEGKYTCIDATLDFLQPDAKGTLHKETFEITGEHVETLCADIERVSSEIWNLAFWETRCGDKECESCRLRDLMR